LTVQNKELNREIQSLRDEKHMLLSINEALGNENDEMNTELEKYHKYRLPKTDDDDGIARPAKRRKGKSLCTDEGESDIDGARVCKKSCIIFSLFVCNVLIPYYL
jgi:hypothetical protein